MPEITLNLSEQEYRIIHALAAAEDTTPEAWIRERLKAGYECVIDACFGGDVKGYWMGVMKEIPDAA